MPPPHPHSPSGIQLRRSAGWHKPENTIVVARPSRWGNPYVVGTGQLTWTGTKLGPAGYYHPADERHCHETVPPEVLTAAQAVWLYRHDLQGALADPDPLHDELRQALDDLAGHNLACRCPPERPCHADALLDLANPPNGERGR